MTMQVRAETALMVLVHDALRRDAARLDRAVGTGALAEGSTRALVRAGWQVCRRQLVSHHRTQDQVLLPMARIYLPARHEEIAVLDDVERGQWFVEMHAAAVDSAVVSGDAGWFAEAVPPFVEVLTRHLDQVETRAVPLLETTLGERDWRGYARELRKSRTGPGATEFWPWVLDGVEPDRQAEVVRRLPAPTRALLTRVWLPRYADLPRWTTSA